MNPDELRSRLAAAFPDEAPPPGLAARAERTAGRIRRGRVAAVAVTVALVITVPSAAALTGADRTLSPAAPSPSGSASTPGGPSASGTAGPSGAPSATGTPGASATSTTPADPGCANVPAGPGQRIATTDADVAAWGYRGDPALEAKAVEIGHWHLPDAELVPLYAEEVEPDRWIAVLAEGDAKPGAGRQVWAISWLARRDLDIDAALDQAVRGRLPAPSADAALSFVVRWGRNPPLPVESTYGRTYSTNMLVVLAPPGSAGTTFRGCREGRSFTVQGSGDVLVRDVGTLDAPGRLSVRTSTGDGYQGPVADLQEPVGRPVVQLPPVEPIPVPQGFRQVFRSVRQGDKLDPSSVSAERATVLIRCRTVEPTGPVPVYVGTKLLGTARCDDSVELLIESTVLSGELSVGRPGDGVPPVSYQVIVVVAG